MFLYNCSGSHPRTLGYNMVARWIYTWRNRWAFLQYGRKPAGGLDVSAQQFMLNQHPISYDQFFLFIKVVIKAEMGWGGGRGDVMKQFKKRQNWRLLQILVEKRSYCETFRQAAVTGTTRAWWKIVNRAKKQHQNKSWAQLIQVLPWWYGRLGTAPRHHAFHGIFVTLYEGL